VIGTMLAGGDSIDDTAVLSAAAAGPLIDAVRAPSKIETWLRAHKWSSPATGSGLPHQRPRPGLDPIPIT
jgi:hypothetical protein